TQGRAPQSHIRPYTPLFRSRTGDGLRPWLRHVPRVAERLEHRAAGLPAFRRSTIRRRPPLVFERDVLADQGLSSLPQVGALCLRDRKSTRLNSSHVKISYAV